MASGFNRREVLWTAARIVGGAVLPVTLPLASVRAQGSKSYPPWMPNSPL